MKITEYVTVTGDETAKFDQEVQQYLNDGYILYGNPTVVQLGNKFLGYAQTVVKVTASEGEEVPLALP
ncbi:MAG: DUF1737 domain-containing protein [Chthoniobacterales bacterium]